MALGQIGLKQHRDKKLLLLLGLALLHLKRSGEREGKSAKELQVSRRQGVVAPLPFLVYCSQSQTWTGSKYTVYRSPVHTVLSYQKWTGRRARPACLASLSAADCLRRLMDSLSPIF